MATAQVYGVGAQVISPLTGSEKVIVDTGYPQVSVATTAAIAALASLDTTNVVITPLTTVGAGTVTAASIIGEIVLRTGPTANFTDTTDTAAAIIAAMPSGAPVGASFYFIYINDTNYVSTFSSGTGVTLKNIAGSTASLTIAPNSTTELLVTKASATTVTMQQLRMAFFTTNSGTFVNNGTSTVTTANTAVTATSSIIITLQTVGGTVGAIPHLLTITPGTGFATVGTASDTSTYTYLILG